MLYEHLTFALVSAMVLQPAASFCLFIYSARVLASFMLPRFVILVRGWPTLERQNSYSVFYKFLSGF